MRWARRTGRRGRCSASPRARRAWTWSPAPATPRARPPNARRWRWRATIFDDYGPYNGATRLVPGSHRPAMRDAPLDPADEARAVQLSGHAGDILVFAADLLHGASLNPSGARRRSILFGFFAEPRHAAHLATAHLRNVRMATDERFDPVPWPPVAPTA